MPVNHAGEEFPYLQVARTIRARIGSGCYPPGGQIPALPGLAAEFGVHPQTIQRAVRVLAGEGLLRVVPGRGTFVTRE